ncbi:hypothetical protein P4418_29330 [Bacillus thuringiensis]|nr:hypothetical protein [Bacillus thuringiensis]
MSCWRRFLVVFNTALVIEVIDLKVLEIISAIWKSGANIYLDPSDNRIGIKRQHLIPTEVMQLS